MPPTDVNQALNFEGFQGTCERRSEGFVKIQKNVGGGGERVGVGGGGRVDVTGEVKFSNSKIFFFFFFFFGGGGRVGSGWGEGLCICERRSEVFVDIQFFFIFFWGGGGGVGVRLGGSGWM